MELEQLIEEFKKQNPKAFETLYEMYCDSISGVIYNIVRDTNIAQEITQDVFIKAWNNSADYSAKKGRFFTWLLNIARNAAIDKTRSKAFKNSKKNLDAQFFVNVIETNESLDNQTDAIGIKKFVSELGEKCKQVLELLYFKGYTQSEASEKLKIPKGTIKTRSRKCINDLRIKLGV